MTSPLAEKRGHSEHIPADLDRLRAGAGDGQSVGTSLLRPNIMEIFVSEVMFSSEVKSTVQ